MSWLAELASFTDDIMTCAKVCMIPTYAATVQVRLARNLERVAVREANRGGGKVRENTNAYCRAYVIAMCFGTIGCALNRTQFRNKMGINGNFAADCMIYCCCCVPCAITQEFLHFRRAKMDFIEDLRAKRKSLRQSLNPNQPKPRNSSQAQTRNSSQTQPTNPNQSKFINPYQAQPTNPYQAQPMNPDQAQYMNPAQLQIQNERMEEEDEEDEEGEEGEEEEDEDDEDEEDEEDEDD